MKRTIIFHSCLLLVLGATQCRKQEAPYSGNNYIAINPGTDSAKRFTFLALGDSYTIGQSVTAAERFPAQTTNLLRAGGIKMDDPTYIATTGWTTDNLDAAMTEQHVSGPYSVVSLLIGVNDQYQRHDTTGYRLKFRNLLLRSISLAANDRNHVFVLSIPDYSVTPFAAYSDTAFIRKQIDWFNAINKEETILAYCHYLDITPSTREALSDPTLIATDGLHPSGKEYALWANMLAPMMRDVLR